MIYLKNNTDPQEIFIPRETVDVSKAFNYYTKEQTDLKLAQNKSATLNEVGVMLTEYATEEYVTAAIKEIDASIPVMVIDENGNFSGEYEKVLRMIDNEETGYQILIKPYDGDTYIQPLGVMRMGDGQGRIMANFVNTLIDITWNGLDANQGAYSLEEVTLSIFTNDVGYVTGDDLGNYATKDDVNSVVGDINKILTSI